MSLPVQIHMVLFMETAECTMNVCISYVAMAMTGGQTAEYTVNNPSRMRSLYDH